MLNQIRILPTVIVSFLIMCFVSCNNGQKSNRIVFQELEPIIEAYVNKNKKFEQPIALNSDEKYPTPSYHLYLYKWNQDTIVSIVQRPFLTDTHILGKESPDSTIFYGVVTSRGLIKYNELPIIIFDPDTLLKESSLPTLSEVPDQYKFQGQNIHRKSDTWDFILKNGEFLRDDREMHLIKTDYK